MARQEMPIFIRTFDFLTWLLPATNAFPRAHRFTFTRRLLDAAFDLQERLEEANHRQGAERLALLKEADIALDKVRLYLRFVVFPTHRRLKRRKGVAFQRRLKRLLAAYAAGEIPLEQVTASVQGWVNHVRFGDTWGLRRAVLGALPVKAPTAPDPTYL